MSSGYFDWMFRAIVAAVIFLTASLTSTSALACPDYRITGEGLEYSSDQLWTPRTHALTAGGNDDLSECEMPGLGFVQTAPDFTMYFSANAARRDLVIRVEADCDTVLLVNDSKAEWHFNDDASEADGVNPLVAIQRADEGFYDIWVGTYERGNCHANIILETFDGTSPGGGGRDPSITSTGTAFLVNNKGWMLTNAHVIEGCSDVEIVGLGTATAIVRDDAEDLAALQLVFDI